MGDIDYSSVISDMTWSYSRITSFEDCPYRWYLKYILYAGRHDIETKDMFFASYGKFMHYLLEEYYTGRKTQEELILDYLAGFYDNVSGQAPSYKVSHGYFKSGLEYLKHFSPLPYHPVAVEKKIDFQIGGYPFVGYIDYLGEEDGSLYLVDHKSKSLKPRSKRAKPTKSDEELDRYFRQLYLYASAIQQETGDFPAGLALNCFRVPALISEDFDPTRCEQSCSWAAEQIRTITEERDFEPNLEFFKCKYLCEMQDYCEYYQYL